MSKPLILLSNDDGYQARGLHLLRQALMEFADVVVCAPDDEQSAKSHALSLHQPLRLNERASGVYSVDGTPADSVYLALNAAHVLPRRPNMVVSGMNHGLNLGMDVFYSGTVAAAREGALQGIRALAISADRNADQQKAAEQGAQVAEMLLGASLSEGHLFNLNFPPGKGWSYRATRLGKRVYSGGLVQRLDPRGIPYFWVGGNEVSHPNVPGSDTEAYDEGVASLTPLVLDLWSSHLENEALALVQSLKPNREPH